VSERIQRRRPRREADQSVESPRAAASASAVDYDALLAEIDDVLESDAEEYVRSFVQKGGQ
jgi:prokaryotic ubiquitin-like protein Pup